MPQFTAGSTMAMMPGTGVAIANPLTGRCGWVWGKLAFGVDLFDRLLADRVQRFFGPPAQIGQLSRGGVDVHLVFGGMLGGVLCAARHGGRWYLGLRGPVAVCPATGMSDWAARCLWGSCVLSDSDSSRPVQGSSAKAERGSSGVPHLQIVEVGSGLPGSKACVGRQ